MIPDEPLKELAEKISQLVLSLKKSTEHEKAILQDPGAFKQKAFAQLQQEETGPGKGEHLSKGHYWLETLGN